MSITNRGEAGSTPGAPRPTPAGSTAGLSGTQQQPAARPPAATRSTTTRSTGTITAKSIGNRRRRAGRRAGRTTRPCATTTTETHTFTMIVTRTPPAPARGEDIRMIQYSSLGSFYIARHFGITSISNTLQVRSLRGRVLAEKRPGEGCGLLLRRKGVQ